MTAQERLLTVLRGEKPDRIPVYSQIPFGLDDNGFIPAAFHGYKDYDNWREQDPAYWRLVKRMEDDCDNFFIWRPECMRNDLLFIPPEYTTRWEEEQSDGRIVRYDRFSFGNLRLNQVSAVLPRTGHSWQFEHYCKSPDDAVELLDLPYEGIDCDTSDFKSLQDLLGEKGLMWVTIPSPIQVVSRFFDPQDFLIYTRTDPSLIYDLMAEAKRRIGKRLETLLTAGVGPVIRFGGAEHATPPLMSPDDFDRLVVEYDQGLVDMCKKVGNFVAYHCHGNIRHALRRFVEMGVDQTDPVECLPDGELSISEAREIASDALCLTGNIQMREIASSGPDDIKRRVEELIRQAGPRNLVISTTGAPLEKIDKRSEKNYLAMIDAANSLSI